MAPQRQLRCPPTLSKRTHMQQRKEIAALPARPTEMRWCKDAEQAEVVLRRLRRRRSRAAATPRIPPQVDATLSSLFLKNAYIW